MLVVSDKFIHWAERFLCSFHFIALILHTYCMRLYVFSIAHTKNVLPWLTLTLLHQKTVWILSFESFFSFFPWNIWMVPWLLYKTVIISSCWTSSSGGGTEKWLFWGRAETTTGIPTWGRVFCGVGDKKMLCTSFFLFMRSCWNRNIMYKAKIKALPYKAGA